MNRPLAADARSRPQSSRIRGRLDLVYFALAAFDVLTICAALLLNHVVTTGFERSVQVSREWSAHLDSLLDMQHSAQMADAPGNDVFYSRNVGLERAREAAAAAQFDTQWNALAAHVGRQTAKDDEARLLAMLRQIRISMHAMLQDSDVIYEEMERGNVSAAARGMAAMDRTFGQLIEDFDSAVSWVQQVQLAEIERQVELAQSARRLELAIGGAVIIIVCFVAFYGAYIGRVMRANEADLARSLKDLEGAHQSLARYADNVSHELRGPLSKMRVNFDVLLSHERTNEAYKEGVASGLEDCERLSSIVDGLLFLARAGNSGMSLRRRQINLAAELASIREMFSAAAEQAGVTLEVDSEHVSAEVDQALFQRSVANLLSNALSNTQAGGRITLRGRSSGGGALVEVEDNGCGIPEESRQRVFDRFESTSTGPKADGAGLGLGLPIAKAIAELHGGSISLASEVGKGTRVTLSFPPAAVTA